MEMFLEDEQATQILGAQLQKNVIPGMVFYLIGDLGAGKTTFVRGFLHAAGWPQSVKSPTYTLVETYHLGELLYYHFDLYRLTDPEELNFIGIRDYIQEKAVFLIEWPEMADTFLPKPDIIIRFKHNHLARIATIESASMLGAQCLEHLFL